MSRHEATSAAAHLLLLVAGLTGVYLLRNASRTQSLWRKLAAQLGKSSLAAAEETLGSLRGPQREAALAMSDEELRDVWLLPALRRLNAAYLQASVQLERQKAWRIGLAAALTLLAASALRRLGDRTFWIPVAWASLTLGLYLALEAWLVIPLLAEETEDAVPSAAAEREAVQRGCFEAAELRADDPG